MKELINIYMYVQNVYPEDVYLSEALLRVIKLNPKTDYENVSKEDLQRH